MNNFTREMTTLTKWYADKQDKPDKQPSRRQQLLAVRQLSF